MDTAQHDTDMAHGPPPSGRPLYAVGQVESRLQQDLSGQLESAVAFADFCTFLTSGKSTASAARLVSAAQVLYDETVEDLARSRPRR